MPSRSRPEFRDMVPGSKIVVPGTKGLEFSYKSNRDGQRRYVGSVSEYVPTRSPFGFSFRDHVFRSKVVIVDDQRTSRDRAQLDGYSMAKPRRLKKKIPPSPIQKSPKHYQPNRSRTFRT